MDDPAPIEAHALWNMIIPAGDGDEDYEPDWSSIEAYLTSLSPSIAREQLHYKGGEDSNGDDNGMTVFAYCCRRRSFPPGLARLMLECDSLPNLPPAQGLPTVLDEVGELPLHDAVRSLNIALVKLLLHVYPVAVNVKGDDEDATPFDVAKLCEAEADLPHLAEAKEITAFLQRAKSLPTRAAVAICFLRLTSARDTAESSVGRAVALFSNGDPGSAVAAQFEALPALSLLYSLSHCSQQARTFSRAGPVVALEHTGLSAKLAFDSFLKCGDVWSVIMSFV